MKRYHLALFLSAVSGAAVLLSGATAEPPKRGDYTKKRIETPVESLKLAKATAPSAAPASDKPPDKFDNPKVEPGKVKWHDSFADACKASEKSGKPVLLLQMMGKLDHKFC